MLNKGMETKENMVKKNDRVMGAGDYMWLWLSMTAQMGIFLLGSSFTGRISYLNAMLGVILSNVIVLFVLILNGDVGTKYGLHFSLYLKAPFGEKGRNIPAFMRALTGIFWFGIQTYYGAMAIDIGIEAMTGYSNWMLWYILFGIIQIFITAGGISWIKYLSNIAAPTLLLLSFLLIYLLGRGDFTSFLTYEVSDPIPFFAVVTACLSYWVTVAVNISDFTRHMKVDNVNRSFIERNKRGILGQLPGIMIGMVVFVSVGMVGNFFTGHGNPVEMISSSLGGGFMIVGLIIVLLAQLSTNITANLYAPGNILSEVFKDKLNFESAVIISGILGLLTFPWLLLNHFLTFLPLIGAFLAPLPGIMIVDYFILRKTDLNLDQFKENREAFVYKNGYNIPAVTAYLIGGIVGIIFLNYSWFFSLPISAIVYFVLMKRSNYKKA